MALLARVEEARETRRRAELLAAQNAHANAAAAAENAARQHASTREQRQTVLRQNYMMIVGRRSAVDIRDLRDIEQRLAAHEESTRQAQHSAEQAERTAFAEREKARELFRDVSMRCLRRGKTAGMLKQTEKRAATMAEEESVSDELMDRIRGTAAI
jgi:hypothetical protein